MLEDFKEADFIRDLIERAKQGDHDAGKEVLRYVQTGIDTRAIVATAPEFELILTHLADVLTGYLDGSMAIDRALCVEREPVVGRPFGASGDEKDSFAALMILLVKRCGTANKAQDRILAVFERHGTPPFERRSLQDIYSARSPMRTWDDRLLKHTAVRSKPIRKLFDEFFAMK